VAKLFKRAVGLGALAGIAYAIWRAVAPPGGSTTVTWEPQPFPFPPTPRTGPEPATAELGAEPGRGADADGSARSTDTA
jgi:hypothetical protein